MAVVHAGYRWAFDEVDHMEDRDRGFIEEEWQEALKAIVQITATNHLWALQREKNTTARQRVEAMELGDRRGVLQMEDIERQALIHMASLERYGLRLEVHEVTKRHGLELEEAARRRQIVNEFGTTAVTQLRATLVQTRETQCRTDILQEEAIAVVDMLTYSENRVRQVTQLKEIKERNRLVGGYTNHHRLVQQESTLWRQKTSYLVLDEHRCRMYLQTEEAEERIEVIAMILWQHDNVRRIDLCMVESENRQLLEQQETAQRVNYVTLFLPLLAPGLHQVAEEKRRLELIRQWDWEWRIVYGKHATQILEYSKRGMIIHQEVSERADLMGREAFDENLVLTTLKLAVEAQEGSDRIVIHIEEQEEREVHADFHYATLKHSSIFANNGQL
eukprot:TRINITY_DN64877_c0_g1_i1.p1 TRINITY_DN64877_c0_g1~~TRINITY_DN64877_c0_g1_i1.p1  ORF type:complete len:390 (-),score=28.86 TRINITY_DN64877_c0_g1_i1:1051-2220(-)